MGGSDSLYLLPAARLLIRVDQMPEAYRLDWNTFRFQLKIRIDCLTMIVFCPLSE